MQLEFTENAQRSIDDFDDKIKRFVVKKLRYLTDNYIQIVATKQVQKLENAYNDKDIRKYNNQADDELNKRKPKFPKR